MLVSPEQLLPGITSLDELIAGNNLYIGGPTDSGKTTLEDHILERLESVRVVFDPEEEPVPGAAVCRRPSDLRRYITQGETCIAYAPGAEVEGMRRDAKEFHDAAFAMGDQLRGRQHKVEHWLTFNWREAQLYAPKEDRDGPVPDAQRRGRKRGIRNIASSQELAGISHTVLKQSRVKCLFQFDPVEMDYFRRYRVPIDEMTTHLAGKHCFAMVVGSQWVPYDKVPFQE